MMFGLFLQNFFILNVLILRSFSSESTETTNEYNHTENSTNSIYYSTVETTIDINFNVTDDASTVDSFINESSTTDTSLLDTSTESATTTTTKLTTTTEIKPKCKLI